MQKPDLRLVPISFRHLIELTFHQQQTQRA
jgi:hypothetical protein